MLPYRIYCICYKDRCLVALVMEGKFRLKERIGIVNETWKVHYKIPLVPPITLPIEAPISLIVSAGSFNG